MQTDNRLLDDLARVAAGALGALHGAKDEVQARLRDQFERLLADLDLVTREEFDAVKAMAAQARTENDALALRLARIEKRTAETKPKKTEAKAARKTAAKAGAGSGGETKGKTRGGAGRRRTKKA